MTLLQKLNNIYTPRVSPLPNGNAMTVEQFWNTFILARLPAKEVALRWHDLLMDYVECPDAVFAIRGYNTASKDNYDSLRRGFLSKTDEGYSFFYTDNFHAAYYLKMAMDGYVPTLGELVKAYNQRLFPSRFGRDTSNERAMMAMPRGADPGIQNAGYKIAHIINVGKDYHVNSRSIPLSLIMQTYFDGGDRKDWTWRTDETGAYYLRDYTVKTEARKFMVAEFLRFVHPFNYFLTPKKTCAVSSACGDIAEYQPLIDYVRGQYAMLYGDAYRQFLDMILVDTQYLASSSGKTVINLTYGIGIADGATSSTEVREKPAKPFADTALPLETDRILGEIKMSRSLELQIVKEYLTNPNTSFRKLERQFMGIDSQARGGGFAAKRIINAYGVTADKKGVLSTVSIDAEIAGAIGRYRSTLTAIRSF